MLLVISDVAVRKQRVHERDLVLVTFGGRVRGAGRASRPLLRGRLLARHSTGRTLLPELATVQSVYCLPFCSFTRTKLNLRKLCDAMTYIYLMIYIFIVYIQKNMNYKICKCKIIRGLIIHGDLFQTIPIRIFGIQKLNNNNNILLYCTPDNLVHNSMFGQYKGRPYRSKAISNRQPWNGNI